MLPIYSFTVLSLLFSFVVCYPSHPHRHHNKHHIQHLVPKPIDIDPTKMSREEVENLHKQLGEYLERTANLGLVAKKADYSDQYENERRLYQNGKKVGDVFSIATNLAMNNQVN
ncbi:hypothetical protein QR680_019349 [Steinernema hermaphroditum]|uniref:Uncharacterized protein n=1 Tax=Steinernema hermaphroditum TaxID=289476 RepID=A0AA39GN50_9BILA|nr:hypothetical protein QR680_019349 [Steinernema hermaphroditum]